MQADERLTFFDSDAFDLDLSDAMADRPQEIRVAFAGPVSVNQMPPRVNTWLAEVKRSDGNVTASDPAAPGTRGLGISMLIDVIDMVMTIRERQHAAERLSHAHDYDARVIYDSGTGIAREVVFARRGSTP